MKTCYRRTGYSRGMTLRAVFQVGCRLWNLGVFSVLILTVCNIFLMLRLLHNDCSDNVSEGQALRPHPPLPPVIIDAFLQHNYTPVFEMNPLLGHWDNRRLLKMIDHALVGRLFAELSTRYSVCLATQSSLEKLHSIVQVAHHWRGPISAALFAAGDEEYSILQGYVDYLRHCYPAVRDRVSFHLAFPGDRLPTRNSPIERASSFDCLRPEAALHQLLKKRSAELLRWRLKNPYPQNHLRNLARKNCQTSKVFLTDIDIIPSLDMADGLEVFIKSDSCTSLCAYVIPTYEVDERVPFPKNKSELVRLKGRGLARPFHHKVFIYNQFATNFSRWEQDSNYNGVHISHGVTNFEFLYEPFYVAPDTVPPHDERFIGYGFTRNTQVYEMYVAGYQFFVLSPVFTVHWGLQQRKGRPSWRERQNTNNRKNFDQFKREVFARYHKDPLNMVLHHQKEGQTIKS